MIALRLPYFIKYNVHTRIVCTWNSQWFLAKKIFLFSRIISQDLMNPGKFIHHKSHLKAFLRYLPCIVRREYFSIIFNVKKCALYLIKYGISYGYPLLSPEKFDQQSNLSPMPKCFHSHAQSLTLSPFLSCSLSPYILLFPHNLFTCTIAYNRWVFCECFIIE